MRKGFAIVLLASAVAACTTPTLDQPTRGMVAANQPVVTRSDYAMDIAAPGGTLAASEEARLDGWFRGLGLGYGDNIYVDGDYAGSARAEVARVAGHYGMLINTGGAPVTAGAINPGTVRVIVSRTRATMAGCPNWSRPAAPDFDNQQMPSTGCSVNGNLTAMVADPQDLVYGREAGSVIDAAAAAKAVQQYRSAPPTGKGGLKEINTKGN